MNTHEQFFRATLGLSSLLVATLAAFSAHAAMSPGYAYEAGTAIVVRDGSRQCVQTTLWSKGNATKECNPELFPEPKVVAAPPPPPPPAPVAKAAPVVVAPVVVAAPKTKVMVFPEAALFAFGKAELTPAGREAVEKARAQFRAEMSSATSIKITGHTDNVGPTEYNQQLSIRRAEAVREYLIKIGGESKIMEVAGLGAAKPIADNKTPAGRAENRRVEVEVIGIAK